MQIALARGAKVFTTVSDEKRSIVEALGAIAIDRNTPVNDYVAEHTGDVSFDIVYDTLGGAILDVAFLAVKRYTGHVVSCLGWGTHALAPLSFRAATYSGVFTLLPLLRIGSCQSWTHSSRGSETRRAESTQAAASGTRVRTRYRHRLRSCRQRQQREGGS